MIWTEQVRVNTHDTDCNSILRPAAMQRYMQECANLQLHTLGPSNEQLRESGYAFLLSRITVNLYATAHPYEDLQVQTFACSESRGYSFFRCYRVLRKEELIAEASSQWAMVSISDRAMQRVNDYKPNFTCEPMLEMGAPERLVPPHGFEPPLLGTYPVRYADTDMNHHMNNTRYIDMLLNFIPMEGRTVTRFSVNYLKEAPFGEVLSVYGEDHGTDAVFRTVRSDGETNIKASFTFSPSEE